MKSLLTFAALGLVAFTQAQEQCAAAAAAIPSCAVSCIVSAGSQVGCGQTDFACQCNPTKSAAIASAALSCVLSACGPAQGLAVQGSASAVCDCVKTAAPASTVASSTASQASTTSASSPTMTTTQTSSVQLSTKPYPTASTAAAPAPSGTGSSGSGSGTGSGSVAPFTGGASLVVGSIGSIVGALFFAMLAL